jgi:predicted Zn finger-like uncharacterized protein
MPILTTCPHCEEPYNLDDRQRGKKVRCRVCSDTFVVAEEDEEQDERPVLAEVSEDEEEEAVMADICDDDEEAIQLAPRPARSPARARRDRDDDEEEDDPRPRRRRQEKEPAGSGMMLLLIGGGVGLLLLLVGGGGLAYYLLSKDDSSSKQASTTAAVSSPVSSGGFNAPKGNSGPKMGFPPPPVNNPPMNQPPVNNSPPRVSGPALPTTLEEALACLHDSDSNRKRAGLEFIGKEPVDTARRSQVAQAVDPLLSDGELNELAARALLSWATKDNVPSLIKVLDANQGNAWQPAMEVLGRLKDERAAATLARSLTSSARRGTAQRALESLGREAETEVVKYIHTKDGAARQAANHLLQIYKTQDSVRLSQTISDLGESEVEIRLAAVEDLNRIKLDKDRQLDVSQALDKLLSDKEPRLQTAAMNALSVWATADNVPSLVNLLNGNDAGLKDKSFTLLAKLKDQRSIEPLMGHLLIPADRSKASATLQAFGSVVEVPIARVLRGQLTQLDLATAKELIHILGQVGTKAISPPILVLVSRQVRLLDRDALAAIKQINQRGK